MVEATRVPMVACWLCGAPVEIRFSKKDKPYLVCNCGTQTFVRSKQAENLLAEKVRKERNNGKE